MSIAITEPDSVTITIPDPDFHRKLAALFLAHLRFRTVHNHKPSEREIPEYVPARIRTTELMHVQQYRQRQEIPAGEHDCRATLYGIPTLEISPDVYVQIPLVDCEVISLACNTKRTTWLAQRSGANQSEDSI